LTRLPGVEPDGREGSERTRSAELIELPPLNLLYGLALAVALKHPASAFVADGSAVSVHRGVRLR